MTRCSLCLQHLSDPPPLSDAGQAVMLAVQHRKGRGEPVTPAGIAAATGLTLHRTRRVLDYLTAEGWLSETPWGGLAVLRWVPTPVGVAA